MVNKELTGGVGGGQLTSTDMRASARIAENLVALINPYSYTGIENLPKRPPYIIAANHDVLRGSYTNMPYDGILINHWLRSVRGISPYWVAKLSSDSALNNLGEASKYASPIVRYGFKTLFGCVTQATYISPDKCRNPLLELVTKLQQGEVVCIFPTGSKYSQKVRAGVLYLSQKAGGEDLVVPIIPVRIGRIKEGLLRSYYTLEVMPPICPIFKSDRPNRDEIRKYTTQIQQSLYGIPYKR